MMKYVLLLFVALIFVNCDKNDHVPQHCHEVIEALALDDHTLAIDIINERLSLLPVRPASIKDPIGHFDNLHLMIIELSRQCLDAQVSLGCYGCIETAPLTSEIEVVLKTTLGDATKFIQIRTPENDVMTATGIRE